MYGLVHPITWDLTFSPSAFIVVKCNCEKRKTMSLLDRLSDGSEWESFYDYKMSLACPKQFTRKLRTFIDEKRYLGICGRIDSGETFPLPERAVIS